MTTPPKCRSRARRFKSARFRRYGVAMREGRYADAEALAVEGLQAKMKDYEAGQLVGMRNAAVWAQGKDFPASIKGRGRR